MRMRGEKAEFQIECPRCGGIHHPTLAALLRSNRTCNACRTKANREAIAKKRKPRTAAPPWSKEELALLAEGKDVPGRTKSAIKTRRRIADCLKRPDHVRWSKEENKLFVRLYPTMKNAELAEHFPGRNVRALVRRGWYLGLRKNPDYRGCAVKTKLTREQREAVPALVQEAMKGLRDRPHIREEIVSSLTLDVLDGKVPFEGIKDAVKTHRTKAYAMFPEKGAHQSLDAQLFDDGPTTLGERIDSNAFRF